ncbi:hypothetical protein MSAN_00518800 [Mycena sanguinolenta]|uniref:Uncharacterized protein n=1 Tax=Mycena sanguinolenta TaxID=230812 RepID=A0A8H6Z5T6_9AGAR|nr:hypothetical protein MSAN_02400500 [Mycena sanguinolenta]KAF7373110.1 hypothetical protein MSAN_00518800 [Mycena sanguinolenta]
MPERECGLYHVSSQVWMGTWTRTRTRWHRLRRAPLLSLPSAKAGMRKRGAARRFRIPSLPPCFSECGEKDGVDCGERGVACVKQPTNLAPFPSPRSTRARLQNDPRHLFPAPRPPERAAPVLIHKTAAWKRDAEPSDPSRPPPPT